MRFEANHECRISTTKLGEITAEDQMYILLECMDNDSKA